MMTPQGSNRLSAGEALTIARIVRVNHAGELGAIRIYSAQITVAARLYPAASRHLGAGELDHLAPLPGLVLDQLAERLRGAGQQRGAQLEKARLGLRIGQDRIDLVIELLDHLARRALRGAEAVPDR